jgi:hypothetical protein
MALAAALCVFGLENKVQAFLLIALLPLLILPFGSSESASVVFWRKDPGATVALVLATIAAGAAAWAAWPLIATGVDRALLEPAGFRPLLFDVFGIYQLAFVLLTGACMLAFAVTWRISVRETITSMAAMAAGGLLTLLLLDLDYHANNVIAVINPLEKMLSFADPGAVTAARQTDLQSLLSLLFDGVASVLARYSFVLHSSPRPTVFLIWLIVPGIVYAWRKGERLVGVQALLLMLTALAIDTLGVRRGLKAEYFIFTDPLIILAGALLLDRLGDFRFHRWAYPVAIALFGLQIVIGQAEPIKYALMRRGPEPVCEWNQYYLPLLALPWCRSPRS